MGAAGGALVLSGPSATVGGGRAAPQGPARPRPHLGRRLAAAWRARRESIIFLHIPKTGGTTLKVFLAKRFPPAAFAYIDGTRLEATGEEIGALPVGRRRRLRLLIGHTGYGLHQFLPRPARYVTVLRDPVDRIVSHYHYVKRQQKHYLREFFDQGDLSLADYATRGLTTELDNGQTRILAGLEYAPTKLAGRPDVPAGVVPFGGCTAAHLERAKENLRRHFALAGILERFADTVELLNHLFCWDIPPLPPRNVSPRRPTREQLSPDEVAALESVTRLDRELYAYARGLFEEKLARVRGLRRSPPA